MARAASDLHDLPWIDRVFGTAYEPAGLWPERYGIEGDPVPPDLVPQTFWPLKRDRLLLALRYDDDRGAREIANLLRLPTAFHVYRRLNHLHDVLRRTLLASLGAKPRVAGATPDAPAV